MSDDEMSEHDILRTLRALSRQSQDLPQALRGRAMHTRNDLMYTMKGLLGQLGSDLPMFGGNPQYRNILEKINPSNPASVQMESLAELCESLSMTSEEILTISGFSVDSFIPVLAEIIASAESIEILLLACRCLAAILDIFSSSTTPIQLAIDNDIVPNLCQKMLNIEYMDVAEVALRMLERISVCESNDFRSPILLENGIVALLQFIDFFPIDVQRTAARTTSLLCTNVSDSLWFQVQMSLELIRNLTKSFDAEIVYQGCCCLKRLSQSPCVQADPSRLDDIIDAPLVDHLLQLFSTFTDERTPENMKPMTYPMLLQLLAIMAQSNSSIIATHSMQTVIMDIFSEPITPSKSQLLSAALDLLSSIVSTSVETGEETRSLIESLYPLMLTVYDTIPQIDSRVHFIHVMYQVTTILSKTALFHKKQLCSFVATALHRDTATSEEVSLALYIVSLALQHGDEDLKISFIRDGIVEALQALVDRPLASTEGQQAAQILSSHFPTEESIVNPVLSDITKIINTNGDMKPDDLEMLKSLSEILQRAGGMTCHELEKSDLVHVVANLLSVPENAAYFREVIFSQFETTWTQWIHILQEIIGRDVQIIFREENQKNITTSTTATTIEMVQQLDQHFKVKISVQDNDTIPPDTVVLVEPLARIEAMEEFVCEKIFGKTKTETEEFDDSSQETQGKRKLTAILDGQHLVPNITILEALVKNATNPPSEGCKFLWEQTHELHFYIGETSEKMEEDQKEVEIPLTSLNLERNLEMLGLLHRISLPIPSSVFVNEAITSSINETLMHPILVASQGFPSCCKIILSKYPFLLGLETKLNFIYASAFGPARAIQYLAKTLWRQEIVQGNEGSNRQVSELNAAVTRIAKIPRLKVRVARSRLLQSAVKLFNAYGGQKAIIEIEYLGEVGTGLGPTTEFYSLVSQEIQARRLKLWRHDGAIDVPESKVENHSPVENDSASALPIRGYHRMAVVHCNLCTQVHFPVCPHHHILLTKSNDGSCGKASPTTEPQCQLCESHEPWAPACSNTSCTSVDVRWQWWIVSNQEVEYLAKAYPRGRPSVIHPVLQCSHCDTVNFPGTDAGIVTIENGRMVSRTGRRMYERDYRAVTKHVSALCEGTPLQQRNILLLRCHVDELVASTCISPEVLDSEIDGLGIDSSFTNEVDVVDAPHGLFPAPLDVDSEDEILLYFEFLGKLVAQAFLDERLLDLPFSEPFLRILLGEDLSFDVISGNILYPLCENGNQRIVTIENSMEYIILTIKYFLNISKQKKKFLNGFSSIISLNILNNFLFSEWIFILYDNNNIMWSNNKNEIKLNIKCDHGYTINSQAIEWLIDIMINMKPNEKKLFVRFVTGSHRLPFGGLNKLEPRLTIVKKLSSDEINIPNDLLLPSASTCTNYFKLPNYSTKKIMYEKLYYCIYEGQLSFHLS